MSSRSTLLSCLVAVLMLIQPLSAALRDCCCSVRVAASVAPQVRAKVVAKKSMGKCPRCRTTTTAQATESESSSDLIRRACDCGKASSSLPIAIRPAAIKLPSENAVAPRVEPLALLLTGTRLLHINVMEFNRPSESGREIRLKHCSWLA